MTEWTKESKENYDWLVKSKEQLKHGQYAEHNRTDVNGDNMDFNRLLEKQKKQEQKYRGFRSGRRLASWKN